jgi:hypothetical protein
MAKVSLFVILLLVVQISKAQAPQVCIANKCREIPASLNSDGSFSIMRGTYGAEYVNYIKPPIPTQPKLGQVDRAIYLQNVLLATPVIQQPMATEPVEPNEPKEKSLRPPPIGNKAAFEKSFRAAILVSPPMIVQYNLFPNDVYRQDLPDEIIRNNRIYLDLIQESASSYGDNLYQRASDMWSRVRDDNPIQQSGFNN